MLRLKVKEVAQSKGFSMGELSRKSNVAYNTIKLIYREPFREVTTTTLNKIAKALDVPGIDRRSDTLTFDIKRTRDYLQELDFKTLFNELGWSRPKNPKPVDMVVENATYKRREIAELSGVSIFEITAQNGKIPNADVRKAIHKEISSLYHENLLIFLDWVNERHTQSLWYWVKRDGSKRYPREHLYVTGQPGDLSLSKLEAMVFDVGDFDESGDAPDVLEVANRLKKALDVERVTKRFYEDFRKEHLRFLDYIDGIDDERDRRWYASVLLNRLMFIYFLQRKWFLDNGNPDYLQDKLAESRERGANLYYAGLRFTFLTRHLKTC